MAEEEQFYFGSPEKRRRNQNRMMQDKSGSRDEILTEDSTPEKFESTGQSSIECIMSKMIANSSNSSQRSSSRGD